MARIKAAVIDRTFVVCDKILEEMPTMKKKLIVVRILVCIIIIIAFCGFISGSNDKLLNEPTAKEKSEKFAKLKKDFNMDASEITTIPRISKSKAIEVAKPYITGTTDETKIKAYHIKLTDKRIAIGGFISKEASDANPILKGKAYPENVSVWLVTFEGIQEFVSRGGVVTETNIVVDDSTGEMLYGFN